MSWASIGSPQRSSAWRRKEGKCREMRTLQDSLSPARACCTKVASGRVGRSGGGAADWGAMPERNGGRSWRPFTGGGGPVALSELMYFPADPRLALEVKGHELNAPQLQAPPGAFHRNTPSRARLGASLGGSVGLKLAVSQLNRSPELRKMVCVVCLYIVKKFPLGSLLAQRGFCCNTYFKILTGTELLC